MRALVCHTNLLLRCDSPSVAGYKFSDSIACLYEYLLMPNVFIMRLPLLALRQAPSFQCLQNPELHHSHLSNLPDG